MNLSEVEPMKVNDVMSSQVVAADPDATISEVARLMSEVDTGIIPIMQWDWSCDPIVTSLSALSQKEYPRMNLSPSL